MFTVKQESGSGHGMWPGIRHVLAFYQNASEPFGRIDSVVAYFESGGDLRFDCGPGKSIIYVMNDNGATVARYDLGGRQMNIVTEPLSAPLAA